MDAKDSVIDPIKDFSKDIARFVNRCHKPGRWWGDTALLSHNSEITDQDYDEHIDIATGIPSSSSSCDDPSFTPDQLCFIMDDLQQIPSDDLEEMDILHQLALLSMRINKFYKRTGRKFRGMHGKTRIGLNKAKVQ
ncbi:hypothetical protein R6Q59_033233 [Mikania micrantha]